jgi:hypothetical protein
LPNAKIPPPPKATANSIPQRSKVFAPVEDVSTFKPNFFTASSYPNVVCTKARKLMTMIAIPIPIIIVLDIIRSIFYQVLNPHTVVNVKLFSLMKKRLKVWMVML